MLASAAADIHLRPFLDDVGQHVIGRDRGVAERAAGGEDALFLGGLDEPGLAGIELAGEDVGAAGDQRERRLLGFAASSMSLM